MGLVVLRGIIAGGHASDIAQEAIVVLIVYCGLGAMAGAIADYLVREAVKESYHKRVAWYREGIERMNDEFGEDSEEAKTRG